MQSNEEDNKPERTEMRFIEDEDLMPWITTHGTAQEGGRKTHFGSYEDGPLCGFKHAQLTTTPVHDVVNPEWISAGVGSREVCLKCAKAYVRMNEKYGTDGK